MTIELNKILNLDLDILNQKGENTEHVDQSDDTNHQSDNPNSISYNQDEFASWNPKEEERFLTFSKRKYKYKDTCNIPNKQILNYIPASTTS